MSALLFSHRFTKTRYLAGVTFLFTLLVIVLGTYTRLSNAGLSCPNGSACFDFIIHRYGANIENILILFLIFSLSKVPHPQKKQLKKTALLLVLLIGAQIFLGTLTVTQRLMPAMVSLNWVTSLSMLASLWWIYLTLRQSLEMQTQSSAWSIWTVLALFLLVAQMGLSGWISAHNKGLACVHFPDCNPVFTPHLQWPFWNADLITLAGLPHLGALIAGVYFIVFGLSLLFSSSLKRFGLLILFLTLLQITLGALHIEWLNPISIAMIDYFIAISLLLTLIALLIHAQSQAPSTPNYFNHLQREVSDTTSKSF